MIKKLFTLILAAACFTATAQVPDYVPTDGLVGWFDFAGDADNGLEDGVNGESSEVGFGPDRFGNPSSALQIPGTWSYVTFSFEEFVSGGEARTVSYWLRRADNAQQGELFTGVIYNVQGCCGLGSFACGANIYEKGVSVDFNGGAVTFDHASSHEECGWNHVVVIVPDIPNPTLGDVLVYENGEMLEFLTGTTLSGQINTTHGDYHIGGATNGAGWGPRFYDLADLDCGAPMVDDVAFYNRAIAEVEVLQLYSAGPPELGCTNPTACNFSLTAEFDDGSCVSCDVAPEFCGDGTVWDEASQTCIIDETYCSWQPDSDGDQLIGVSDLLMFLSVFGDTDLDQDGIFDSNDDCVGEYDECGVCNGSGPSIPIIESIEILYDSLYAEQIDEWWVFEVGADTMFSYVCELVEGCTDQSAENYNADANVDDGSCWACGMPLAYNYDSYETVLIGDQCWFAENLATSFYSNGEPITEAESSASWYSSSPRQAAPHWEFSEVDSLGRVYNWYAMTDSRGVCPSGWHVASKSDFQVLGDELAPDINSSLKDDVTWDGTNSSGFTAILTGYLTSPQNDWQSESYTTMIWMDEPSVEALWLLSGPNCGYCEELQFLEGVNGIDKQYGYFIRCIKDTE